MASITIRSEFLPVFHFKKAAKTLEKIKLGFSNLLNREASYHNITVKYLLLGLDDALASLLEKLASVAEST